MIERIRAGNDPSGFFTNSVIFNLFPLIVLFQGITSRSSVAADFAFLKELPQSSKDHFRLPI